MSSVSAWNKYPVAVIVLGIAALPPRAAPAQNVPLGFILPELLGQTITLQTSSLADQNHTAHFQPDPESGQLVVPAQVNGALLTLLSTYPVGTPAGGFTYIFDPALGTLTRSSDSFGPSFAERALTAGRGKVNVGFGYQHAAYDTFEGLNLRQRGERGMTFYIPHNDCCSPGAAGATRPDGSRLTPPFEGDVIEAQLALDLVSDTSTLFASYGVSDRLDIGVVVPFVRVTLDASVLARIERLATEADPSVHAFPGNADRQLYTMSGTAAGLGDIVVRSKYAFTSGTPFGLAAAVEARLPTGDESNLLGTGGVQTKLFGIASFHRGPVSPHVNVGYAFSSKGALPDLTPDDDEARLRDEIVATVGADVALTSRVTASFDVLSRTLRDAGRMRMGERTFEYQLTGTGSGGGGGGGGGGSGGGGNQPAPPATTLTRTFNELTFTGGNLQLYLGAAGIRFNPWRTLLVTANLLFPMTEAGVRDRVTPAIGIDYVF